MALPRKLENYRALLSMRIDKLEEHLIVDESL